MNKIPEYETHWFQLKDTFLLKLKDNLLQELLEKGIKKAGNLNQLAKNLNMSCPTFYNLKNNKGVYMISVGKLKRLLSYLNVNYSFLNNKIEFTKKGRKISIKNPKFPFNLKTKEGAYLLGCIVSDGTIYIDKKARNKVRTKYSSSDEESTEKFKEAINKTFGEVYLQKELNRGNTYLKVGSSIIGEALLKIGAHLGNKTKANKEIPWLIKENKELSRHYLSAIFGDEGSSAGNKHYQPYLTLSRSNRLNNILTKKELNELNKLDFTKKRKFPTGHTTSSISFKKAKVVLPAKIINKITNKGISKLLLGESELLK
ncbi:hypothetical protein HN451_04705, partial [archaeon]|nr:hypothetical protein [archaeon]